MLNIRSKEFGRWKRSKFSPYSSIKHPLVGDLKLNWSANGNAMVVLFTSKASITSLNNGDAPFQVNLLNDDTYRWICAMSMEILDLLNEESVSGVRSGKTSLFNSTRSPTANV